MDKVVVFGGSGFIGSHVADDLTAKGYDVVVFDRVPSPWLQESQTMVVGDLLDRPLVREVVEGARYVYHFGGQADIGESSRTPWETMEANVMGTCAVLEACAAPALERFVFASSMYIYSELGSFYRVSKQACEKLVEEYGREFGMGYTILRIGTPYGGRANSFNSIRMMVNQAWRESRIDCNGSPDETREYIHVADVVRVSAQILDEAYRNRHVNITGNERVPLARLTLMIREILGRDVAVTFRPRGNAKHYQVTPYAYRPSQGVKITPDHHVDLGQGLLELMYEVGGTEACNLRSEMDKTID